MKCLPCLTSYLHFLYAGKDILDGAQNTRNRHWKFSFPSGSELDCVSLGKNLDGRILQQRSTSHVIHIVIVKLMFHSQRLQLWLR